MTRAHLVATTAIALAFAPISSAFADGFQPIVEPEPVGPLPAVSAFNGKAALGGGGVNGEGIGFLEASVSAPFGHSFGVQGDALVGYASSGSVLGGGVHGFWRDPSVGLVGLYGGVLNAELGDADHTVYTIGAEAAAYLGAFTVEGYAGYLDGDEVDSSFAGVLRLAYYPIDDLRLSVGGRYIDDHAAGIFEAEYQLSGLPFSGVSVFGRGLIGDDDEWQGLAGLRIYLAPEEKSLIRRHREDDPTHLTLDFLFETELNDGCEITAIGDNVLDPCGPQPIEEPMFE